MGVAISPAINFARRILNKYSLKPPIDVKLLIKGYATLVIAPIPLQGVDGVSLNLKTPGKATKVIVNSNNPPMRQRFTLAHELGHIVIPWHTGSIVDHVDPAQAYEANDYWEMEDEANVFAGELLVPYVWLTKLLHGNSDLAKIHKIIAKECKVSLQVAAIRMIQILPKNIVYLVERSNVVEFSGKTEGTIANTLEWESEFSENAYDYCEEHFTASVEARNVHWWRLPGTFESNATDTRGWSDILRAIIDDIGVPEMEVHQFKQSINGVVGYANSVAKRSDNYSAGAVVAACMQRFKDRDAFRDFVEHPDFEVFIVQKARSLVETSH